jgi:hypothetical protein
MTGGAADTRLAAVAAAIENRVVELGDDMWKAILATVPELRADELVVGLLRASVVENVARILHRFQHRFPRDAVTAPVAAIEYARRLAQRHIDLIALLRFYRVGHARYLAWCLAELANQQ